MLKARRNIQRDIIILNNNNNNQIQPSKDSARHKTPAMQSSGVQQQNRPSMEIATQRRRARRGPGIGEDQRQPTRQHVH